MTTPLCLDESILSLDTARAAIEMGSCRIINIKVGRVGGAVEMRKIHDYCEAHGVPVWCGGMLESGDRPGPQPPHRLAFRTSSSRPTCPRAAATTRRTSSSPAIELSGPGKIRVPDGPGIGVNPVEERIRRATVRAEVFRP